MKINRAYFIVVAIGVVTQSCTSDSISRPDPRRPTAVKTVSTFKVGETKLPEFYEATGTVKAKTTTQISASIMGRILSFPVIEGDRVSRGQVLVEIDGGEIEALRFKAKAGLKEAQASLVELERVTDAANAAVRTAEASKLLAERTFRRYSELHERHSASDQEFDDARYKFESASSELDQAHANVASVTAKNRLINARIDQAKADITAVSVKAGYLTIVAPVSGIVVRKFAEAGSTSVPGTPLLAIEDNSQYRLEASVEETSSRFVQVGSRARVRIDAIGQDELDGKVIEVLPTSDSASRSYLVKIELPPHPFLKTGLYGVGRFFVAQKDALTAPQSAIVLRGQLTGVYIVQPDGTVQFRLVRTGKSTNGMVELLSGVSSGDEIVDSSVEGLSDGVRIR
jgi:multidrug efflux pump subunit AcrA (membrane-fusion protein)